MKTAEITKTFRFENNCNLGLIELSRLEKTKNNIKKYSFNFLNNNMLNFHEERIHFLLKNHLKFTKSSVARYLLLNWAEEKENFTVVFPKDYRIALENINKKNHKIKKLGE